MTGFMKMPIVFTGLHLQMKAENITVIGKQACLLVI